MLGRCVEMRKNTRKQDHSNLLSSMRNNEAEHFSRFAEFCRIVRSQCKNDCCKAVDIQKDLIGTVEVGRMKIVLM